MCPAVAVLLGFLSYIGLFNGNLRVVVPGRVYRSGLLGPQQLEQTIKKYHLHTVISLRGGRSDDEWFRRETAVCERDQVKFLTISLSANQLPPPSKLRKLLRFFDQAAYPVLFHCKGGADRSGLAATLYLHLYEGVPLEEARKRGLTWRYGHLGFQTAAMDEFFDLYRQHGAGQDLRAWISSGYEEIYDSRKKQASNARGGE